MRKSRTRDKQRFAQIEELCKAAKVAYRHCPFEEVTGRGHPIICLGCETGGCEDLRALGIDNVGRPLHPSERPRCGAKNRKGTSCKLPVEPGKRRCHFHGGASTGPKTAAGRARIAEAQRKRWAKRS